MNRQHFGFEKSIRLNVANETLKPRSIKVKWTIRDAFGNPMEEKMKAYKDICEKTVEVPPLSTVWLDKVELPEIDVFSEYVSFEGWEEDTCVSEGTVIFSYPKYFRYEDPKLTCIVQGDTIEIAASAYAKSVEILNETEDMLLSDNYFDMNAGTKMVKILRGEAKGLKIRSVYEGAGIS